MHQEQQTPRLRNIRFFANGTETEGRASPMPILQDSGSETVEPINNSSTSMEMLDKTFEKNER